MRSAAQVVEAQLNELVGHDQQPLASLACVAFVEDVCVFAAGFGRSRIGLNGQQDTPATPDTLYRVASISKLATALGVLQLAELGKLDLNTDISGYFGYRIRNPQLPTIAITPRMLLSHTSSIRDGGEAYSAPPPFTIADFLLPHGQLFHDGIHWATASEPAGAYYYYANLNYGILGTLIERLSAERFDNFMRRALFDPLNITANFGPFGLPEDAFQRLATLYRKRTPAGIWEIGSRWYAQIDDYAGKRPATFPLIENPDVGDLPRGQTDGSLDDYVPGRNATIFSPQGGMRISVNGLAKLGMALYDHSKNGLFSAELKKQLRQPIWRYRPTHNNGNSYDGLMRSWGHGVQLCMDHSEHQHGDRLFQPSSQGYVGHSGEAYGLLSGLWLHPVKRCGFAYAIGGVGGDPDANLGRYSSFTVWEEAIMTSLAQLLPT